MIVSVLLERSGEQRQIGMVRREMEQERWGERRSIGKNGKKKKGSRNVGEN